MLDLETLFEDSEVNITVVSQDDTSLVLDIAGKRVVIIAVLDEYHNPILSTRIFWFILIPLDFSLED